MENSDSDESVATASKERELDNLKHFQAYQLALQQGVNVSIRYFKLLFSGPPRVGKTSARRRLIGEILNLKSARSRNPETKEIEVSSSTGAAESIHVIVQLDEQKHKQTTALLTKDNKWMAIKSFNKRDLDKELDLLYRFIHEATQASESRSIKSPTNQPMLLASHDQTSKPNALISASDSPESHSELKSKSLFSGVEIKLESDDYDTPLMISEAQHSTLVPADSDEMMLSSIQQPSWKETNEKVYNAFNKVLQSKNPSEYLEVLLEGTSLINMIDTGGQPAFLEMLPVLTVGPAMYLVFLNLIQNLKDRYEIRYATEEGDILLNTCSYTIQEVIFQILSSIVAFSRIEGNEIFPDPSQAVLFVGTHKDKLESTASVVEKDKAIQRELKQVLQTDMCNQLLCRASDSDKSLVLAIDNETGDEHEIETMRKRLAEIIESKFKKYDIPATWLMFNLFLRKLVLHDVHENSDSVCSKTNVGVIPLEQCKDIAMELHVTDLEDALWFFHHVVGSLMYFPEVKELEDIVICNPQVVFDSVTTLIIQTFKSDDTASQRFKETGQFSYEDIEKAVRETSSEFLPPAKLICLLEYRNIIAPIEAPPHSKSSKWYFFPAILECATSEQLQKFEQTKEPNDPPPLMIHFKFGFVPMGLFCAVIANLVTQIHSQKLGWLLHCEADTNKSLYKNQLTFRTGPRSFDVTLISLPKRFEVHLTQRQTETDVESTHHTELEVCRAVLESICDTLDKVISQIKLSTKTEEPIYQLGFKCPRHSDRLSDDLVLNKATSDSSRSPKLLWYDFLSNKSCFQCLNSEDELSKNEVFNPKFLNCLSWFGISNLNRLKLLLITEQPESQVKIYGDEVSFKVEVIDTGVETKETDSFQYQWFKDNTEITLETHPYCRGANKSTLHISAILPQYEGNYKCEVRSKDGNIVWSNNATLKVVTQASLLMLNCLERNIGESVMASSPVINHSSQSNFQLLPLVPPSLEVVDYNGKVLLGPDDGIKINIPPGTVPESEVIHVQIQSFVPVSNDAIDLPRGMKLFSPIYHISTFSKKFQKDIQLSMFHYAKLLSRSDTSKLTFLHSTDKTPPYRFTELSGGEFDFDSCSGTIHLQSFCKVAQAGSIGIVEKFMVYFLHPIPTLNSKCMCALFSACYKHSAYLKYLKDEMEGNFPDAKLHPDYEPVELAEGSEHFELIIPHEDVRKQGYTIQLLTRRTTKISVKAVPLPPQESAESAGYPFAFPVPFRLLHVKGLRNCTSVGDLECDLVVSGAKETPEPFVLRACAEAPRSAFGSEKTGTSNKTDAECEYMFADANRYFDKLDRRQIVRLGTELGLGVFSVESMKNLPDDMLRAWFRKEDRVKEVCGDSITWEMLVEALKRIGQNGIADNILKEKCEKQIREDDTSTERSDLQTEPNHKRETRSAATQAAAGSTTSTPQIPSVKNQTQKKSHSMTRLRSRSRSHSRNHPRISLHSHSPRGFVSSRGNYRSPPQRRYRSRSRSSPRHRQDSPLRQSLSRRSRSSSPRDWRRHSMERRDRDRDRRCRSSSQRSQVYTSESSNTSSPQRDKDKDRDGSRKRGRSSPSMKRSKKSKKRHHESSARLRTSTSSLESSSEEPKTKERRKK